MLAWSERGSAFHNHGRPRAARPRREIPPLTPPGYGAVSQSPAGTTNRDTRSDGRQLMKVLRRVSPDAIRAAGYCLVRPREWIDWGASCGLGVCRRWRSARARWRCPENTAHPAKTRWSSIDVMTGCGHIVVHNKSNPHSPYEHVTVRKDKSAVPVSAFFGRCQRINFTTHLPNQARLMEWPRHG